MDKKKNHCIRVFADQNQINNCKQEIKHVNESINHLSKTLSLAGNEVRLKILYLLHKEGEMCPCDLSDILSMTVPAISQHLRKMKDVQIIKDKKVGQTIFYSIIDTQKELLNPIFKLINQPQNIES